VLRALAGQSDSVGVSEVARTTGLAKSTCSRILSSLDELGIVERVDEAGRYVIGSGLRALAAAGAPVGTLRDLAEPYLRELAGRLGESAALSVMDGGEGLYVTQVAAPGPVQVTDWTGQRFPLHTIAAGQAFMGSWTDEQLAGYAANGLAEYTDHTVTTLVGLRQRVGEVRRRGVAWTLGEFSEEITGVAAPVCDPDGEAVASVSIYGPGWRFPGDADTTEIERVVRETAERVGALLGG
jgi:DNA-binding IclR family transcriptional regulator